MSDQTGKPTAASGRTRRDHVQPAAMHGYELPTYPFRMPAELSGSDTRCRPVVIVGAGLTGLTLALDLGLRDIPVVLIDEDNSVGASGLSSRGVVYVHRTLEIFDRLGVADRIVARGAGWTLGRVFKGEKEVYTFRPQSRGGRLPPNANLQQFFVEEALVDRIAEVPLVDLRWSSRVVAVDATEAGVSLRVVTPQGEYGIDCDWLVACDGGNSFIREQLGATSATHMFDDIWCIADIRPTSDNPSERRLWMDAAFNNGGVVLNHNMAAGVCRYNFQISHYDDPGQAGSMEALRGRLAQALGPDVEYDFVWTGIWRYKRRLIDRFSDGRVFFAGDAAHQVPPFGARGGNSGVADADNLGWKLAAVVRGDADVSLLGSYHDERQAAAVENVEITSRSARFLAPDTPGRRLFRDAVLDVAHDLPALRPMVNTGRLAVAQAYPASPLNMGGDWNGSGGIAEGEPPVDGNLRWPGKHDGPLLDLVRDGFAIIWFVPPGAECPEGAAAAWLDVRAATRRVMVTPTPQDVPVENAVDHDGALSGRWAGGGAATYVVRPDGHVIFRASGLVIPPVPEFLARTGMREVKAA